MSQQPLIRFDMTRPRWPTALSLALLCLLGIQAATAWAQRPATVEKLPPAIANFVPAQQNPVFTGAGPGHWDAKIRERGWILFEEGVYHLWYTGYDGTREGIKLLGYATSPDGLRWTRWPDNPLVREHWVEDMMVVKQGDTYYMFAEGKGDRAQLLTSRDRIHWNREGTLDIRQHHGEPLSPGPFGTPTAWFENGVWYLFYERGDAGVWLAQSTDRRTWTNVQDEPVLLPGPAKYDNSMIAMNQILKIDGAYYASYHGSGDAQAPRTWNTDLARSTDLIHWQKYAGNPLVPGNRSSGVFVLANGHYRLYTMHDQIELFTPSAESNGQKPAAK